MSKIWKVIISVTYRWTAAKTLQRVRKFQTLSYVKESKLAAQRARVERPEWNLWLSTRDDEVRNARVILHTDHWVSGALHTQHNRHTHHTDHWVSGALHTQQHNRHTHHTDSRRPWPNPNPHPKSPSSAREDRSVVLAPWPRRTDLLRRSAEEQFKSCKTRSKDPEMADTRNSGTAP